MSGIVVAGAGAFGTALAVALCDTREVVLWGRHASVMAEMGRSRTNRRLPGVALPASLAVTGDPEALARAEVVLLAVPAQALRPFLAEHAGALGGKPLVACGKGIDLETLDGPSAAIRRVLPDALPLVLTGPSFAADIARGLPTAVALSARDGAVAEGLAAALTGPTFRVYHGTDVRGVEIGGAAKNVLAIACGAVSGRGLGESARAALTARGFAELMRFAAACGARPETLMGLSGLGDVVLSCASAQSRNFAFGERLGRGVPAAEAAGGKLVEGAFTAGVLVALARAKGVEMPVAEAVDAILSGHLGIDAAVEALMGRPVKAEH